MPSMKLQINVLVLLAFAVSAEVGFPPRPVCSLPPVRGPCSALYFAWAYDPAAGHCRFFVYGGCYGNANNFRTCVGCMKSCTGRKVSKILRMCHGPIKEMERFRSLLLERFGYPYRVRQS
ncbi:U-actitoxin-Avd3h-like isoform X2 [Amblyomma americanum]